LYLETEYEGSLYSALFALLDRYYIFKQG